MADGSRIHKPVMMVEIGGQITRALCDTGSYYTHVSGKFVEKLLPEPLSSWSRPKLYAATPQGIEVTPWHEFRQIEIRYRELGFATTPYVGIMRELTYDAILGIDLMHDVGLVIIQSLQRLCSLPIWKHYFETLMMTTRHKLVGTNPGPTRMQFLKSRRRFSREGFYTLKGNPSRTSKLVDLNSWKI